MTPEEVLCAFMEPKPAAGSFDWSGRSKLGFWVVNPIFNDFGEPAVEVVPVLASLGYQKEHFYYLHKMEDRLTDMQWGAYASELLLGPGARWSVASRAMIHADPKQKIKALAAVLGPLVERGDRP